jgi:hypothetical protein
MLVGSSLSAWAEPTDLLVAKVSSAEDEVDATRGTPPAASGKHVSSDDLGTGPEHFDHDDLGLSIRIGRAGGF